MNHPRESLLKKIEDRTVLMKEKLGRIGMNTAGPYSQFAHLVKDVLLYEEAYVLPSGAHQISSQLLLIHDRCAVEGVRGDEICHFLRTSFPLLEEEVLKLKSH